MSQMNALDERQQSFREFDKGVFNILKLALAYDMTQDLFNQVEKDIRLTIPRKAAKEMLLYTDKIEIYVSGRQWKIGWWWGKRTLWKHINATITFEPYSTSLAAWTDPKEPGGIVCFQ